MSVTGGTVAVSLAWGGAWVLGDQVRQRRRRLADLVERSSRTEREMQRDAAAVRDA